MAATVTAHPSFSAATPVELFKNPSLANGYDVASDGKRSIVMEKPAGPPLAIHVVQDWFEEFRPKAP
jgi:hypothetical protein